MNNSPHYFKPAGIAAEGFTLIELSIVLVIIGLIVGGILTGRDLIHTSELRSLITQKTAIDTAITTFRGKYGCLPGDCTNATTLLGAADDMGHAINNGNGDGVMGDFYELWACTEDFQVWLQLAKAGLISGSFAGVQIGGITPNIYASPGINVPVSKISNIGVLLGFWTGTSGNTVASYVSPGIQAHLIMFGLPGLGPYGSGVGTCCALWGDGAFTPSDVFYIDNKIDDGVANTGMVRDVSYQVQKCSTTAATPATWSSGPTYDLRRTDKHCVLGMFSNY